MFFSSVFRCYKYFFWQWVWPVILLEQGFGKFAILRTQLSVTHMHKVAVYRKT